MKKYWKYILPCFLMGMTLPALAIKASYNRDQLAEFNATNQCYNCDLSSAELYGDHSSAIFDNSNLTGTHGFGNFSMTNFAGSNLSSSSWIGANLSYAQLNSIIVIKANFKGANLSYANFDSTNTNDAIFDYANLYGANISQQQLDSAASYCWATLPNGNKKNC